MLQKIYVLKNYEQLMDILREREKERERERERGGGGGGGEKEIL